MLKYVFFDLDGTLLPMNQDKFVKMYFTELCKRFCEPLGLDDRTLVKSVWKATDSMIKNDRSEPNINVFWKIFAKLCGEKVLEYVKDFDDFYANEFSACKAATKFNPAVPEAVKTLRRKGYTLVAATNPLFPPVAIENRLDWAGLDKEDFELITTYVNSSSCKPNPLYFEEIMEKLGAKPEECLMVGNDVDEDMIAAGSLGIDVFLVTDCLINRGDKPIAGYRRGAFRDFLTYARVLPDVR